MHMIIFVRGVCVCAHKLRELGTLNTHGCFFKGRIAWPDIIQKARNRCV